MQGFTFKLTSAVLTLAFLSTILAESLTTAQVVSLTSNSNVTTVPSNDTTAPEPLRGFESLPSSLKPLNGTDQTTMNHDYIDATEKFLAANVESGSEDSTGSDDVSGNGWIVHKNISHLFISENDEIIERPNPNEGVQMRNVEESKNLVSYGDCRVLGVSNDPLESTRFYMGLIM